MPDRLKNTSARLIAMAVSLVGEAEPVRREMGCSHDDFRAYCAGEAEPTWPELDKLIRVVVREQGNLIATNRELMGQINAKLDKRS